MDFRKICIIVVIFSILVVPCRKSDATPAVALVPAAKWAIGALLVSAGIGATSGDNLDVIIQEYWDNAGTYVKDRLVNSAVTWGQILAVGGVVIDDYVWNYTREFSQANYNVGENLRLVENIIVPYTETYTNIETNSIKYGENVLSWAYEDDRFPDNYSMSRIAFYVNGVFVGRSNTTCYSPYVNDTYVRYKMSDSSGGPYLYMQVKYYDSSHVLRDYTYWVSYGENLVAYDASVNLAVGEAVLDNPTWDWRNEQEQKRMIPPPPPGLFGRDIDGNIDKSIDPDSLVNDELDNITDMSIDDIINSEITTSNVDVISDTDISDVTSVSTPDFVDVNTDTGVVTGWLSGVTAWLKALYYSLADWIQTIIDVVVNGVNGVIINLVNILSYIIVIADYLSPFSDNFFLKIALVPTGVLSEKMLELKDVLEDKFDLSIITEKQNEMELRTYSDGPWEGIQADFTDYGMGVVTVVDPAAANYYASNVKTWLSGFIYFFMLFFTIKRFMYILSS